MIRAKLAMTGLGAALVLAMSMALAVPVDCSTGAGKIERAAAFKDQASFLDTFFETRYGCRAFEAFVTEVNRLERTNPDPNTCKALGMREAASDTIKRKADKCFGGGGPDGGSSALPPEPSASLPVLSEVAAAAGECWTSGARTGEHNARLYCSPSPMGKKVSLCAITATTACLAKFDEIVNADDTCREEAANDPHYDKLRAAACAAEL